MDLRLKKCEVCKKDAKCLCYKCLSYFCDDCFKLSHNNEEYKNHKKEKYDYYVPIDLKCPQHKIHPNILFCTNEKGKNILLIYLFFIYRIMLSFVFF